MINNLEKNKRLSAFLTEVHSLQDQSLLKKSDQERKASFKALRRQEEEKKKEELEKLMKDNN